MNTIAAVSQEPMHDTKRYKQLLARFRHMMVNSGAMPQDITEAQLADKVRGETDEERLDHLEQLTSLVPEHYWWSVGL